MVCLASVNYCAAASDGGGDAAALGGGGKKEKGEKGRDCGVGRSRLIRYDSRRLRIDTASYSHLFHFLFTLPGGYSL